MRRVVDVIAVLTTIAGAGAVGVWAWNRFDIDSRQQRAIDELRRLDVEIKLRAQLGGVALTPGGWPATVDPKWFENPPRNPLLSAGLRGERPWVEIAPPEQAELHNPPLRMALTTQDAAFWYNPYLGVVRARVPSQVNDSAALAMYNSVNATTLQSIHHHAPIDRRLLEQGVNPITGRMPTQ